MGLPSKLQKNHIHFRNSHHLLSIFFISDKNFFSYLGKRMEKIGARDKLMLRCHITHEEEHTCSNHAAIQTQMCSFKWKINIPELSSFSEKLKVSPQENIHFDIMISESSERIYITIEGDFNLYELKIMVLDDKEVEIDIKDPKYILESTQRFETWIEKWKTTAHSCSHLAYSFNLICVISAYSGVLKSMESASFDDHGDKYALRKMTSSSMQQDLKNMLLSETHTDVKLRVGDHFLPAHKCLLSARSPVFATM
nr:uncharacterized protein LOC107447291 [Parasteatoda tepidariorum]